MKLTNLRFAQSKPPWRVLFFGTDKFSVHILQALNENRMSGSSGKVVKNLCVAHPLTKKLTPVNKYSHLGGILQYEWPLRHGHRDFDVGIVASFGHLIPAKVIDMFPHGVINVHPSPLPRWRGAAPLYHTILQGDETTGVSIMALEPKHFDRGKLLLQKEVPVSSKATTHSLRDLLGPLGGKMIINVLSTLTESLESSQSQDTQEVTYAHKVNPQMCFIDWQNQTCDQIDRQYRSLHQSMDLRSEWNGMTVRLLEMVNLDFRPTIAVEEEDTRPGLPIYSRSDDILWVKCRDGWVGFKSVMMKKKMTAKSFHNGYLSKKSLKGVVCRSIPSGFFEPSYFDWIKNPKPSS